MTLIEFEALRLECIKTMWEADRLTSIVADSVQQLKTLAATLVTNADLIDQYLKDKIPHHPSATAVAAAAATNAVVDKRKKSRKMLRCSTAGSRVPCL